MEDFFMDRVIPAILIIFVTGIMIAIFAASYDGLQGYRAYNAKNMCNLKQMDYNRQAFSSKVTCIPYPNRRDTTNIKLGG